MNKTRYCMLVVALFLALTLSALNVAPAFADESIPPEPAVTEEVAEVIESGEVEEVVDVPEPAETGDETLQSSGEPESAEESPTVAEIIESLPADTELIVVDENGEALPLASEEAAEIIEIADPQWCPVGVTPGAATCSGIKASFNGGDANTNLIQWLIDNQPNKAGVIWIAYDYVGTSGLEGGPVVLDGDDYTSMDNFALTINGGWSGDNNKLINPNTPSTFEVPFVILDWTGAITINNIVIEGASGGSWDALGIYTDGNVVLNNVDVQNNTTEWGAYISNTTGTGTVTVNDSTFNDNTGTNASGLEIYSNNTITLKNVTANGNAVYGVSIDNSSASTPKAVTLNGTNHFNYNGEDGLSIYTKGVITLNNVTALGNTNGSGAYLTNCDYDPNTFLCNYGVASGVTLKGTNNFSDNGWDGLRVFSGGVITVSNITATGNGTDGNRPAVTFPELQDYNAYGKGAFLHNLGALTPKNIVISGTNTFNENASIGLTSISSGKITVNNITANGNGCDVTKDLDTQYCAGSYLEAYMGVTQTGYGRFDGNAEDGFNIGSFTKGAATFINIYTNGNGRDGLVIAAFGTTPINITINGTNIFTNNGDDGLEIDSDGIVTLSNITANNNAGSGAVVDNTYAATPKAVILKGAATFNNNVLDGLFIWSHGAITTAGLTAIGNDNYGVFLDNCEWDGGSGCLTPIASAVTVNGNNYFDGNFYDGILVNSRGAITVNNVTANNSIDGWGILLDNQYDNAVAGVTIKGYAFASYNDVNGLSVYSNGAITLANITSNGNSSRGAYIDNNTNTAKPMNVTIIGTNSFSENGIHGLSIFTYGTIVLNNITANYNGDPGMGYGAQIFNNGGTMARPVTINGTNTFNGNYVSGLLIQSLGAIKVNNLMANNNLGSGFGNGAFLTNDFASSINQSITVTGYGIFNNNSLDGLLINSNGNVTLANITASSNGGAGLYIDAVNDATSTSVSNFTITGFNIFNSNNGFGLRIEVDGAITVSNITANNNGGYGAFFNNWTYANVGPSGIKNVIVSGVNMFNGNQHGLWIDATGVVTLTRITAHQNNDFGAGIGLYVNTNSGINLTCGLLYNNTGNGYYFLVGAGKVITLKGVFTYGNPSGNIYNSIPIVTRACPLP